jgi:cytochrome P450
MVDEVLRLESPVQWLQRVVTRDTVLSGVKIPKGSLVLVVWGAGNRDGDKFDDPDRFQIDRPNVLRDHLGFGYGIHKCIGARLARLEGQIAFERLLARLSDIRLAVPPELLEYVYDVNHRQLKSLPIQFEPA